ncbi:E3 ubiquitin/ISG15 ligase TRIM25-like [Lampetra fluviatilis]
MATPAAAAAVSDELSCSICLGAFHCPSTLSCGHSFCLRCLEKVWKVAGRCFCPQCRAKFEQKPQLSRNVALANLVEEFSVGVKAAPQVSCDSCLDGEVPAVRSCLTCETSLCESHCKRHLQNARFKDHELVELGVNMEARKCKKHEKRLEFYCTQDECLVCTSCAIVGEHAGHKFSSVEDAHEARKEELRLETTWREENKNTAASQTQSLMDDYRRVQESLRGTKERISREFERRREQLREEEREALERVDEEGRSVLSRIQAAITRYESRARDLEQEINQLLAALTVQDPLSFLQDAVHVRLRRCSVSQGTQNDPAHVSSRLNLAKVISVGGVQTNLLAFEYGCSPTLDTNSAHNNLQISLDLRTVTLTNVSQGRRKHPHELAYLQVLCSESFSSGQHYWEVDVGDVQRCRIGVAYGTIPRKGDDAKCLLGGSDVSWSLRKHNDRYSVWHGGVQTPLSVLEPPRRVGVHLDWNAGLLSYYSADSMVLLHSVHHIFTKPLYPGLRVGGQVGNFARIMDLSHAS